MEPTIPDRFAQSGYSSLPRISVVIPTYNRSGYLREAVESVQSQTYPFWELMVVDDGSTDDTAETMQRYLSEPRIHFFRQHNQGQAVARNVGISNASGDYVAFLDSDNRWLPHKLELQVEYLLAHPDADVLFSENEFIDAAGNTIGKAPRMRRYSGKVWRNLLWDNFVPFNTSVVRRECLSRVGGMDESVRRGDDYDLWLRLAPDCEFHYLPLIVGQYRVEGDRISTNVAGRLESNRHAIERFIANNPELMTRAEERLIWSRFHERCTSAYLSAGKLTAGLHAACLAVQETPLRIGAWNAFIRTILKGVFFPMRP